MKRGPIVGRIAIVQHSFEDFVGIGFRTIGPQGRFIIHPSEDDDFRVRIVAEEQPEPAIPELCPKPMLVSIAERRTLPIDGGGRIRRYRLENELVQSRQELSARVLLVLVGLFRLQRLNGLGQLFQLIEKEGMRKNGPTIDREHG